MDRTGYVKTLSLLLAARHGFIQFPGKNAIPGRLTVTIMWFYTMARENHFFPGIVQNHAVLLLDTRRQRQTTVYSRRPASYVIILSLK